MCVMSFAPASASAAVAATAARGHDDADDTEPDHGPAAGHRPPGTRKDCHPLLLASDALRTPTPMVISPPSLSQIATQALSDAAVTVRRSQPNFATNLTSTIPAAILGVGPGVGGWPVDPAKISAYFSLNEKFVCRRGFGTSRSYHQRRQRIGALTCDPRCAVAVQFPEGRLHLPRRAWRHADA